MQLMHSLLPLGLPCATWLLTQPRCPPKYRLIRRMAFSGLGSNGKLVHRRTEGKIWLVNWERTREAAKMIRSNPNYMQKRLKSTRKSCECPAIMAALVSTQPIPLTIDSVMLQFTKASLHRSEDGDSSLPIHAVTHTIDCHVML